MLLALDLPRRRLRVPLARPSAASALWDWAFAGGSIAGDLRAGHRARRAGAGHPGRRPRLCRRLVGLADAVQPAHRHRPGHRLRAARRHLADHEDRRRAAGARAPLRLDHGARHAGADRRRQPVDAAPERPVHGALVRLAAPFSTRRRCRCWWRWRPSRCSAASLSRREAPPFLAALALFVLSYVGLGISFYPYIVPPSITIWEAAAPDTSLAFLLVGAADPDPADPRLHRLVLLGVPRQGRPAAGYH